MAGQLPRPWFRLGSIARPAPPSAPAATEPRPAAPIRPPIIRPSAPTQPSEATTPPKSAADKSSPSSIPALPRPSATTRSLPPSPAAAKLPNATSSSPAKKPASPSAMKPAASSPSPSSHHKAASPPTATSTVKPSPLSTFEPKARSRLPPSPTNAPSPFPSPTIADAKPAVPSPKHSPKPTASPPSPLALPPPQLGFVGETKHADIPQEVERKTVVVKKIVDKSEKSDHFPTYHAHKPGIAPNGKQEAHKDGDQGKERGMRSKKVSGTSDQETNMRVITMAGENRGAFMEVFYSDKKNGHQISGNSHDSEKEGKLNNPTDKDQKSSGVDHSLPMKAFFNSNVQGINNSIMLDSSFTHHDPGIHLVFSRQLPAAHDGDGDRQQS